MHVVIIGAGEVGTSIAASLASTTDHEVVVIDVDPDRADQLKYELDDVLTIAATGPPRRSRPLPMSAARTWSSPARQRPDEPRRVRDRENAR